MTDMPATLIPEEIQDDLINAMEGLSLIHI